MSKTKIIYRCVTDDLTSNAASGIREISFPWRERMRRLSRPKNACS